MEPWVSDGCRFKVLMASEVQRDGNGRELTDLEQPRGPGPAAEIFYSDADGTITFSALSPGELPLDIRTRFIETARSLLPPKE